MKKRYENSGTVLYDSNNVYFNLCKNKSLQWRLNEIQCLGINAKIMTTARSIAQKSILNWDLSEVTSDFAVNMNLTA